MRDMRSVCMFVRDSFPGKVSWRSLREAIAAAEFAGTDRVSAVLACGTIPGSQPPQKSSRCDEPVACFLACGSVGLHEETLRK